MKAKMSVLLAVLLITGFQKSFSQSHEAQQLLLNVEKLAQLKQILKELYKGYQVVNKGYTTIKDLSEGNFDLHKTFLDALLDVSPAVKRYSKIADIISAQATLVKEYKRSFRRFKESKLFNAKEIEYMGGVYTNLFNQTLRSLDELLMVTTANRLRMSDEERFAAIDKIFVGMEDKLSFLRHFNRSTTVLAMQRGKDRVDTKISKKLHGLD